MQWSERAKNSAKMGSNVPDKEHGKLAWKLFQISIKRAVDLKLPWVEFFYSSN